MKESCGITTVKSRGNDRYLSIAKTKTESFCGGLKISEAELGGLIYRSDILLVYDQ